MIDNGTVKYLILLVSMKQIEKTCQRVSVCVRRVDDV